MIRGRGRAFKIRVAILSSLLLLVTLYAVNDWYTRQERLSWRKPLNVALVVVTERGVDENAVEKLRHRLPALEETLSSEARRYRIQTPPFHFVFYGPVAEDGAPPQQRGDGFWELARYSAALWKFSADIDARGNVPTRAFDSRLYLIVRAPLDAARAAVEGSGQQGGRIGLARAELDEEMADFALFVAAHELFHTLGASDKYDTAGRSLVPQGLADPQQAPLFPQRRAELMARTRPLDTQRETAPTSLSELGVGAFTAAEIGWQRGPQ